jgi:molecular chaperone GrpE
MAAGPTTTEQTNGMTERKQRDEKARAEGDAAQARETAPQADDAAATVTDAATLAAQRDEYLDHLQRLKAEFENYRKRVRRDGEELRLRAAEGVVESLLPVMDNMQRALHAAEQHEEGQLIQGVELVAGQLRNVLASHGLERLEVEVGSRFDPTMHDAVLTQPSDELEEGSILRVLEPGYLLHGRLLRAAKVIVVA